MKILDYVWKISTPSVFLIKINQVLADVPSTFLAWIFEDPTNILTLFLLLISIPFTLFRGMNEWHKWKNRNNNQNKE